MSMFSTVKDIIAKQLIIITHVSVALEFTNSNNSNVYYYALRVASFFTNERNKLQVTRIIL